jgi:hypothetical protein
VSYKWSQKNIVCIKLKPNINLGDVSKCWTNKKKRNKNTICDFFRNNFLTIPKFKKIKILSGTPNLVCTHDLLLINLFIFPWSVFVGENFVSINWPMDVMSWPNAKMRTKNLKCNWKHFRWTIVERSHCVINLGVVIECWTNKK